MSADSDPSLDPVPPEKERTKTFVRRLGRLVLVGGGFAMFLLMMISVVDGIRQGTAWDPYTGKPVGELDCLEEARGLLVDAGPKDELDPPWVGRYRKWVARCREDHADLYEILQDTHSELQNRSK